MTNEGKTLIGKGVLIWPAKERRSDRYGTVFLMADGQTSETLGPTVNRLDADAVATIEGFRGRLIAHVISARKSTHVGDIFRGIFPSTPAIGDEIVLGDGIAFSEHSEGCGLTVGLAPIDGRPDDWLDPEMLYRAHEQLVELYFAPATDDEATP